MKSLIRLSAIAAVLVASATYASAATINIGSFGSVTNGIADPTGLNNTVLLYTAFTATPLTPGPGTSPAPAPGGPTYNVLPGIWTDPAGTVYVSVDPLAGNGSSPLHVLENGDYTYTTTFTIASAGAYTGSIDVLADDTTAVAISGPGISFTTLNPGSPSSSFPMCATLPINCIIPTAVSLDNTYAVGTYTLTFDVQQAAQVSTGLDFYGSIASATPPTVPEPSTLLMFGTGLVGSAGALFRRMRK